MSKGNKKNIESEKPTIDQLFNDLPKRDYKILEASIKDGFCNFVYEVVAGVGLGNKHKVTSKVGYVKQELTKAFAQLNVHLAVIDDVFKHADVEIDNIHTMHGSEFTTLYTVTGFKIGGSIENENIILSGDKYVSGGGRITLETPKISIDDSSSYKWYYELCAASIKARNEVAKYHEGNYDPIEEEEVEDYADQIKMSFTSNETADMTDFENAQV